MTLMNDSRLDLGGRLRTSRVAAGLEQRHLADRLHVSRQTVSNWERGTSEPNVSQFVAWAEMVGQSLEWLAEGLKAKAPAVVAGADVRPEGFEPPTFCSVASGLLLVVMAARMWATRTPASEAGVDL
jgi:transcriptional regulator with XRE-family HTH domain